MRNKPLGGLWTSTWLGYGSDWTRWCEDNDWDSPTDAWRGFLLAPKSDARVLVIDSVADMLRLPWESPKGWWGVNWATVFDAYDGVHLTERGQRATHLPALDRDLYGWDAESTCWARWVFDEPQTVAFAKGLRPVVAAPEGGEQ
jgi:hypothetical protein